MPKAKTKFKFSVVQKEINRLSPIKFGADFFTLRVVPPDEWTCGDDSIGCIHYNTQAIHIKATGSDVQQLDTLFHECIHGVLSDRTSGKFDTGDVAQAATFSDIGEVFTKATEIGLIAIFLDNPDLLKLLVSNWRASARRKEKQ